MRIRLLGHFEVEVEGRVIDDSAFARRQAASLVKLLALSSGRRLHREQVIDALWPDATLDEAAPRLHKAASYARRAIGDKRAVVMRDETVLLWPDSDPIIDVEQFEAAADLAYSGSVAEAEAAADLYGGDLLPSEPYVDWLGPTRDRLRLRYLEVLRTAGRWEAVIQAEPADEEAHLALMKNYIADGQRLAVLRQYERLERSLTEELGVSPCEEAVALRRQVIADQADTTALIDRGSEREVMQRALDDAQQGIGSLLLLSGVAGIGKSALGHWLVERAEQSGWIAGTAVAASVDGIWPYAPMMEAIDDVLRRAPELLDELPDTHRAELNRVRQAPATSHDGFDDDDGHQRLFVAVDELVRLASRQRGLVLFIDDLHLADDSSLALLHYIGRQASRSRLLLVGTARSRDTESLAPLLGLARSHRAREIRVGPFGPEHVSELIASVTGDAPPASTLDKIVMLSGGTPFYVEELTRSLRSGSVEEMPEQLASIVASSLGSLSAELREVLPRVAVAGTKFDTDEFVALSGVDEHRAFEFLDEALAREVVHLSAGGYEFRHGLVRDGLLERLAPHRRRMVHREAAHRFEQMGAPPARVAHHLIAAQQLVEAAPWALRAAKAAHAVGALSDARALVDSVVDAATGEARVGLLALRADVLAAMGDHRAVAAYHRALAETEGPMRRLLRAKMSRAALMGGDLDTASAALAGLEPDGGMFDGPILHAQGMLAYFCGDLDLAEQRAAEARQFALGENAPAALLDVLTLQGLVAHNKGEWFDRMRLELTSTASSTELAATVFDCHL